MVQTAWLGMMSAKSDVTIELKKVGDERLTIAPRQAQRLIDRQGGAAEFKLRKWLRDPVGAFNCD
jgi:hypothetical protein